MIDAGRRHSILTAIHMHFFCETIFAKTLTRETNVSDSVLKGHVIKSALSITIPFENMTKCSCVCIWRERMIPEEIRSSGCGNQSRGCIQQNPVQPADGPAHAVWRQPNTCPVDCGSAHGNNSGYATGNLSSALHQETMDVPKWSPLSPVLFQCLHQRPSRSEPKWAHIQNIQGLPGSSRSSARSGWKRVPVVSRPAISHQSRQGTAIVVHSWQQSSRQTDTSSHIWWRCGRMKKSSEIHGIHSDRMLTYRKHVERTALKCKKYQSVMKALAATGTEQRHLFLLYQSVVLSATDYRLGLTTMAL